MIVHFICRGNVLRSLIAETYLKSLHVPGVTTRSSGTVVDVYRESDKPFLEKTKEVLHAHGLGAYVKSEAEQLTQERLNGSNVVICMNRRVFDEASALVILPKDTIVWEITDIGEGERHDGYEDGREVEEVIYDEIVAKVDVLVARSLRA